MDRLLAIERGRKEARLRLKGLSEALCRAAFLPGQPGDARLEADLHHIRRVVSDNLIFRLGDGFGAPVIAVFAGGTGVGKSTLVNTIAGRRVSEISVKRPCTTSPLVYHHKAHRETLAGPSFLPGYDKGDLEAETGGKGVVLSSHDDDSLRDIILIDSPDFDSVSERNRDLSEDILRVADLVLYVVNPEKYADDEVWQVIRKIRGGGRRAVFLFNRAEDESDEAVEHFRELLREADVDGDLEIIFEWRDVSMDGRIKDPGSARRIREVLADLVHGGEEGRVRGEVLRGAWEEVRSTLERKVLPILRSDADLVRELEARMKREWSEAERRILEEARLEHAGDRQRASEILRANLFDIVHALEKKVFGPVTMWIRRWSGTLAKRLGRTEEGIRSSLRSCHDGNRGAIRRHLREGADRVRAFLAADARGKAILETDGWQGGLLTEEAIDSTYEKKRSDYEAWLREEFEALTRQVKAGRSFQLAVLQILYLVLLLGTMATTGGAITLAEGLLAGPIIMLLDRLFVKAIDWEVVERLHKRARERFQEIFPEIVAEQLAMGASLCESLREGSAAAAELGGLLNSVDDQVGPLVDALTAGERG